MMYETFNASNRSYIERMDTHCPFAQPFPLASICPRMDEAKRTRVQRELASHLLGAVAHQKGVLHKVGTIRPLPSMAEIPVDRPVPVVQGIDPAKKNTTHPMR